MQRYGAQVIDFAEHVARERRLKIHGILEDTALELMAKLKKDNLLSDGNAVTVSVFDNEHEKDDEFQFVKIFPEFTSNK